MGSDSTAERRPETGESTGEMPKEGTGAGFGGGDDKPTAGFFADNTGRDDRGANGEAEEDGETYCCTCVHSATSARARRVS